MNQNLRVLEFRNPISLKNFVKRKQRNDGLIIENNWELKTKWKI